MWNDIVNFVTDGLESLLLMLVDFVCMIFESLLDLVKSATDGIFNSIDTSMLTNAMGNVPAQILNVAYMVGVGEAVSIIIAALIIRFILQLIPFIRLGS